MKNIDRKSSYLSLLKNNKDFMLNIYYNVIFQITITLIAIIIYRRNKYISSITTFSFWIYIISLSIIVFIITNNLKDSSFYIKLIFFIIYAIINGALLYHIGLLIPKDIIDQVLIGNILIFISLIIFTYIITYYNYDISITNLILFSAIIGALIDIVLYATFKYKNYLNNIKLNKINDLLQDDNNANINHKIMLYSGLILYCIYIYYTSNVILRYNTNDIIISSIDIYFGFLNTFIYVFNLDKYI